MRTRTLIPVIATAAICAAVFGVLNVGAQINPGSEATPERCTPPKGTGRLTVMSNTNGRVWLKQSTKNNIVTRKYYACSNSFRRHIYLATTKHQDLVDEGDTPPFSSLLYDERALDFSAVAFVKTTCNPAGENANCNYVLRSVRLRDGKILHEVKSAKPERPSSPVVNGALLFYVVDTDNSTGPECGATPCEVRMIDVNGTSTTLDTGSRISPLAISGVTLFWTNGDHARGFDFAAEPPRMLD